MQRLDPLDDLNDRARLTYWVKNLLSVKNFKFDYNHIIEQMGIFWFFFIEVRWPAVHENS